MCVHARRLTYAARYSFQKAESRVSCVGFDSYVLYSCIIIYMQNLCMVPLVAHFNLRTCVAACIDNIYAAYNMRSAKT